MGSVEEQRRRQGYFVRLGSLSARLRHRAYEHSLGKLRQKKHHAQDTLAQLQETLELVRALRPPPPREAGQEAWTEDQLSPWSPASLKREAELGSAASGHVCSGLGQRGAWGWGSSGGPRLGLGFVEGGRRSRDLQAVQVGRETEKATSPTPLSPVPELQVSAHTQFLPPLFIVPAPREHDRSCRLGLIGSDAPNLLTPPQPPPSRLFPPSHIGCGSQRLALPGSILHPPTSPPLLATWPIPQPVLPTAATRGRA